MKCYCGKENKLGNLIIESCNSYEDAANKIEQIKKIRRRRKYILKKTKAAKLGLNFEKIGLVVGNMV